MNTSCTALSSQILNGLIILWSNSEKCHPDLTSLSETCDDKLFTWPNSYTVTDA